MRLVLSREIGAENFVVSTDPESMKKAAGSLDLILNTVSHQGFLLADSIALINNQGFLLVYFVQ